MSDPHGGAAAAFKPSRSVDLALIVSTSLSILGCALVVGTYVRWRRLRRHPASLVIMRCLLDLAICAESLTNRLYRFDPSSGQALASVAVFAPTVTLTA